VDGFHRAGDHCDVVGRVRENRREVSEFEREMGELRSDFSIRYGCEMLDRHTFFESEKPVRTSHLAVKVRDSSVVPFVDVWALGGDRIIVPVRVSPAETVKLSKRTLMSRLSMLSEARWWSGVVSIVLELGRLVAVPSTMSKSVDCEI